jgi:replication factor C subunit 3/5
MSDTVPSIPWIEKYRPSNFQDIVLDPLNRELFDNCLEQNYFPNLLFYGPPGTGKTTTIINFINEYQIKYNRKNKSTVIHLNASDERGVDIIRNQIHQFVKSLNLFETGMKFVILDEVDYMTKNAQQALKYILQTSTYNVRFCLICNYITKIDEALKNEFITVRFNQLPQKQIYQFLRNIADAENLNLTDDTINTIQCQYNSDVRSMINYIQLNHRTYSVEQSNTTTTTTTTTIMNDDVMNDLFRVVKQNNIINKTKVKPKETVLEFCHYISVRYNIDKRSILQKLCNFLIRNHPDIITTEFLNYMEIIIHRHDIPIDIILNSLESIPIKN